MTNDINSIIYHTWINKNYDILVTDCQSLFGYRSTNKYSFSPTTWGMQWFYFVYREKQWNIQAMYMIFSITFYSTVLKYKCIIVYKCLYKLSIVMCCFFVSSVKRIFFYYKQVNWGSLMLNRLFLWVFKESDWLQKVKI